MRLAYFIDSHIDAILNEWDKFSASLYPAAGESTSSALRDHAGDLLRTIAEDLRTAQTAEEQQVKPQATPERKWRPPGTPAEIHAVLRAASGFTIQQLVSEYRALRASVLRLYEGAFRSEIYREAFHDIRRFNEAVDQAIAESVDFYSLEVERWRNVFLGVLAHDLRGPLQANLATAKLLSRPGQEHTIPLATGRLIRSGERMRELLDDLLDFNRTSMEIGIPVQRVTADLRAACQAEIEMRRAAHPECEIEFDANGGEIIGSWDASRMKQALGNLISNAVQYATPSAPVRIVLSSSDTSIRLSVENPGPIIPVESIPTLFEPYRRGSQGLARAGQLDHLGLGLFIVREVARAHQGTVEVESTAGRTVFTMVFPRRPAPPEEAPKTSNDAGNDAAILAPTPVSPEGSSTA